MDEIDRKILSVLQENGRESFTTISEEVGVSEGTVRNRVNRMVEEETIERFTVDVSRENLVEAFVMVDVSTEVQIPELVDSFPSNVEAYELAGEHDILVRVAEESSEQVNDTVDGIRALQGVESTTTYMVLNEPT